MLYLDLVLLFINIDVKSTMHIYSQNKLSDILHSIDIEYICSWILLNTKQTCTLWLDKHRKAQINRHDQQVICMPN